MSTRKKGLPFFVERKLLPASRTVDVLVVDDNRNNLLAMESVLGEVGAHVVRAESGNDALLRLLDQDFALILLDVQMPGLDGYETAALIRRRDRCRNTPIIFITAFGQSDTQVQKGYELGAVDYLFKPIVPGILKSKVSVFLDLHEKTEEVRRQAQALRVAEAAEHERKIREEKRRFEAELRAEELSRERRVAEAMTLRAEELARTILERERAEAAREESNARLAFISETANRLLLDERPQELIAGVFTRLSRHLGLEVYQSHLASDELAAPVAGSPRPASGEPAAKLELVLYASDGLPADPDRRREWLAFGQLFAVQVAEGRRRRILSEEIHDLSGELSDDDCAMLRSVGVSAYACFPLIARQRLVGTLGFGTRLRASFGQAELATMQVICDQVAMAVERARLIADLQDRNEALAEASRRKDEFLAMLGHELRNPLVPIVSGIRLLAPRGDLGPEERRTLEMMDRQARHLVHLVDELLDVSRITTGHIELHPEPVELSRIVEDAMQVCDAAITLRRHALSITLPPSPVRLRVDRTRMTQVLSNLLNNAARYTDPGGHIDLCAAVEGDEVVITVRDDGIGVSADMLGNIFELFVQTDRTADRSQGGLGVGLTLVRRLLELHGGSIAAFSDGLGTGASFVIRLPPSLRVAEGELSEEPAREPARENGHANGAETMRMSVVPPGTGTEREGSDGAAHLPAPRAGAARTGGGRARRGAGMSVLLVEDNPDVRDSLRSLLEFCGHDVGVAETGWKGVELVLARRPAVALIDIGLPGLDGYGVAREIRRQTASDGGTRVRLIALTGYGQANDRKRALDAGFDAHLVKPVDIDVLQGLLENNDRKSVSVAK